MGWFSDFLKRVKEQTDTPAPPKPVVYGIRVKYGWNTGKYRAWCVCPRKGKVWRDGVSEISALLLLKEAIEADGYSWPVGAFPGLGL